MPNEKPKTRHESIALLEKRIEESGLSVRQFALKVMLREDRTIRRWLTGESPIPNLVLDFLTNPWEMPWPKTLQGGK